MIIYAVLLPFEQPELVALVKQTYPLDHLRLSDTQWLVATNQSVVDVSKLLKLTSDEGAAPLTNVAVVFATSSYFGRTAPTVWDWIKLKLEGSGRG